MRALGFASRRSVVAAVAAVGLVAAAAGIMLFAGPARAAAPGDLLWTRGWLPAGLDEIRDIQMARAPNGDLIVAGTADRSGGDADFAVARYSPGGTRRWAKLIDTGAHHRQLLAGLAVDRAGNAVLVGSAEKTATLWCTIKVSPSGKRLWVRTRYGPAGKGASKDVARAVGCDSRDNVYVAGALGRTGESGDIALTKYTPAGVRRWTAFFGGLGGHFDDPTCLVVDGKDRIFVGGMVVTVDADACVLRYNTLGKRIWYRVWDGDAANDVDRIHDIAVGPTGVAAAGTTDDAWGQNGGLVLKLGLADGSDVWAPRVEALTDLDYVYFAVATNAAGQVAATGSIYDRLSPRYPDLDFQWTLALFHDAAGSPENYGTMGASVGMGRDVYLTSTGRQFATGTLCWEPAGTPTIAQTMSYRYGSATGWTSGKEVAGRDITGERLVVTSDHVFVAGTNGAKLMLLKYVR